MLSLSSPNTLQLQDEGGCLTDEMSWLLPRAVKPMGIKAPCPTPGSLSGFFFLNRPKNTKYLQCGESVLGKP